MIRGRTKADSQYRMRATAVLEAQKRERRQEKEEGGEALNTTMHAG